MTDVTLSDFKLGALVLPATDGMLAELGFDVQELGPLALGVVTEEGSRRSSMHFPEIKTSLWADHSELKDVVDEMRINPSFRALEKYLVVPDAAKMQAVLIGEFIRQLKATHVLGVDHGKLSDVWEEAPNKLGEYYSGDPQTEVTRLSLGVEELMPEVWDKMKERLGERLVLTRFLPSGMHKLEVSIYFRRGVK